MPPFRAANAPDIIGLFQRDYNLFQVFYPDTLPLGNNPKPNRPFICVKSQIQHHPDSISASGGQLHIASPVAAKKY